MTILTNSTGKKAVKISKDATGKFRAFYVLVFSDEDQVLQAKDFASIKNAEKWAAKILN